MAVSRKFGVFEVDASEVVITPQSGKTIQEGIVGEVRMFISTSIPGNFLLLDGSTLDLENDYPALYTLLGNSNTLPDFRDRFVRAWGATRDPNTLQDEEFKSHTHIQDPHTHVQNQHRHNIYYDAAQSGSGTNSFQSSPGSTSNSAYATATNQNTTATNQNAGGTETRPKNISVVFAICAK